ncbi:hypothetical protein CSC34_6306 [Pseudomonas aeruginosa]|nr:hypothetical protein CSC34_6306 [Pseudomonas aeruginosa]
MKRVKVEKSDEIQALLEKAAAKINQALNECLSAHMMTDLAQQPWTQFQALIRAS